jgi:hypothetical protein
MIFPLGMSENGSVLFILPRYGFPVYPIGVSGDRVGGYIRIKSFIFNALFTNV